MCRRSLPPTPPSSTPFIDHQPLQHNLGLRVHWANLCCASMLAMPWNDMARRSVVTCLSCSGLVRTTQAIASTSRQRLHQRNHSSSKSSSASKNEPRVPSDAPAEAKVPGPETPRRSSTRLRRRARESVREPLIRGEDGTRYNLPSVPSTQHIHPPGT